MAGRPASSDVEFMSRAVALWEEPGETGYHPRLFCQLALPYKDPGELAFWERRNGSFSLIMRPAIETLPGGRRRVGYPFGSIPRLLLSWLATETVRTQRPKLILGESLTDFMRQLGMSATGGRSGTITRLRRQMNRLFDATISAQFDGDPRRDVGHNFTIVATKSLWWTRDDRDAPQASLLPSTVRLSAEFFRELIEHPVPVDLDALRVLQSSPLRLDIYTWLTHRNSYARARCKISWAQLQAQFGSTTSTETWRGRAKFRESFTRQLRYVLAVYRDARVEVEPEGVVVFPASTHVGRASRSALAPRTAQGPGQPAGPGYCVHGGEPGALASGEPRCPSCRQRVAHGELRHLNRVAAPQAAGGTTDTSKVVTSASPRPGRKGAASGSPGPTHPARLPSAPKADQW